jgi:hypothetical protein
MGLEASGAFTTGTAGETRTGSLVIVVGDDDIIINISSVGGRGARRDDDDDHRRRQWRAGMCWRRRHGEGVGTATGLLGCPPLAFAGNGEIEPFSGRLVYISGSEVTYG